MAGKPLFLDKNLQIIFFITLMAVMGVASITPAFPEIASHYDIPYKKIGMLITAFTLPGIFLTPFLGILADRFGRKTILVPALFLFAIAGFACSQVNDYETLVILRFIQGIGGASIGSLNVTLIGDLFSKNERAEAMGYNASVLSTGTALYPAIGGGLAMLGWNYPFYLPLLGIPAGLFVIFSLDSPAGNNKDNFRDYLIQAAKGIAKKQVLFLFIINILTFIILYGSYLTYFPYIMKTRFESEPYMIGLVMSVASVTTAITSSFLGKMVKYYSPPDLLKMAYPFYILSLVIVPFLKAEWMMFIPSVLFGVAQGVNIPNIQTMLVGLAPTKYRAAFMSLNGMVLRIGQTLGPLVAGFFFAIGEIKAVFFGGALVAVLMIGIVIFGVKKNYKVEEHL